MRSLMKSTSRTGTKSENVCTLTHLLVCFPICFFREVERPGKCHPEAFWIVDKQLQIWAGSQFWWLQYELSEMTWKSDSPWVHDVGGVRFLTSNAFELKNLQGHTKQAGSLTDPSIAGDTVAACRNVGLADSKTQSTLCCPEETPSTACLMPFLQSNLWHHECHRLLQGWSIPRENSPPCITCQVAVLISALCLQAVFF